MKIKMRYQNSSERKIWKKDLQPPFRQKELLPLSGFIGYCQKYDVKTDRNELEYFERERLLLPAVRVNRGIIEYKRVLADYQRRDDYEWRFIPREHLDQAKKDYKIKQIDKITTYGHGSILYGRNNWLDWYIERKMVVYPAKTIFKPWSSYTKDQTWANDPKKLGHNYETFYSPLQMYPLQFIQNRRSITIKNDGLFKSPEAWVESGKIISEMFTKEINNEFILQKVLDYYKLFRLINDLEDLWEHRQQQLADFYNEAVKGYDGNYQYAENDLRHRKVVLDKELTPEAKKLLSQHKFSIDSLENWRLTFLGFGTFGLRIKVMSLRKPYLKTIEEETLATTEHPYKVIYLINWLIKLCGGRETTIKELILGFSGKYCPYCKSPYEPKRKTQVSCGSDSCKRAHENELKRRGRKAGLYKS